MKFYTGRIDDEIHVVQAVDLKAAKEAVTFAISKTEWFRHFCDGTNEDPESIFYFIYPYHRNMDVDEDIEEEELLISTYADYIRKDIDKLPEQFYIEAARVFEIDNYEIREMKVSGQGDYWSCYGGR